MATIKDSTVTLEIKVATGTTDEGKTTFATRSLSNVSPDLTDDQFVSLGNKFSNLQSRTLSGISRRVVDQFDI